MSKKEKADDRRVVGFLGVGLDNRDGHQRMTKCENFLLVGGSEETHETMQETAVKFTEELSRRGKRLEETPLKEVIQIFHESVDKPA